jgi:LDH2 family malate/lactate/ureidoglycolate dehydrogenase
MSLGCQSDMKSTALKHLPRWDTPKISLARNQHRPIPLGWALNQAGEPTTDPQEALDGIILPMAEHKGYALAAMVDMLSGVLTGSGFLSAVHSPYQTTQKR